MLSLSQTKLCQKDRKSGKETSAGEACPERSMPCMIRARSLPFSSEPSEHFTHIYPLQRCRTCVGARAVCREWHRCPENPGRLSSLCPESTACSMGPKREGRREQ